MSDSPIEIPDDSNNYEDLTAHGEDGNMMDDGCEVTGHNTTSAPAAPTVAVVDAYSSAQALAPITIRLKNSNTNSSSRNNSNSNSHSNGGASNTTTTAGTDPFSGLPSLHLLPCRIAHTGPANVPNFFRPSKAADRAPTLVYGVDGATLSNSEQQLYDARFRGRQMTGSIVTLPPNAKGFIFEDDENANQHTIELDSEENNNHQNEGSQKEKENAVVPTNSNWKTHDTFDSFMLWQPDLNTNERDRLKESISEWIPVAHAIHAPIE